MFGMAPIQQASRAHRVVIATLRKVFSLGLHVWETPGPSFPSSPTCPLRSQPPWKREGRKGRHCSGFYKLQCGIDQPRQLWGFVAGGRSCCAGLDLSSVAGGRLVVLLPRQKHF